MGTGVAFSTDILMRDREDRVWIPAHIVESHLGVKPGERVWAFYARGRIIIRKENTVGSFSSTPYRRYQVGYKGGIRISAGMIEEVMGSPVALVVCEGVADMLVLSNFRSGERFGPGAG